jgi:hypothetical protein
MTEATETTQAPPPQPEAAAPSPAVQNPAVAFCCDAYARAQKAAKARGKGVVFAAIDAQRAYRKAMPPLCGLENIRDFIACAAHGMLIGAIDGADGARLLYAAQVAHTTVRNQPASPKSAAL